MKKTEAWAILDRKNIMFIGGCATNMDLNHLEIYPTKRDALRGADPESGLKQTIVKVSITYTLPTK